MIEKNFWLAVLLGALPAARAGDWRDSVSPHFVVHRQRVFGSSGLVLDLERIHSRLRLDLAMFSPWMAKERIGVYIYADAASFKRGEFHPPAWSNGLAYFDRRIIVVYDQPEPRKLDEVIAHELTHLLFESYWGEEHKSPPHWLNEGLAMMEETGWAGDAERSDWFQATAFLGPRRMIPFSRIAETVPNFGLRDRDEAGLWYVGAYSAVLFLHRRHSRLQFLNFCSSLRGGKSLREALWSAFRYSSAGRFESAWRDWLRDQSRRFVGSGRASRDASRPGAAAADAGRPPGRRLRPLDFRGAAFHNLRDKD